MQSADLCEPFLAALEAAYRRQRDLDPALAPVIDSLLAALTGRPAASSGPDPQEHPTTLHLPDLLAQAGRGPHADIVRGLPPLLPSLTWINRYEDDQIAPGFRHGFAFCEIVGSDGLVPISSMRCGLIIMAPRTFYPLHHHIAVELYLVLAGTGEWLRGAEPWTPRPPGSFILHGTSMGHAMRTGDEPVLAIWAWHGDLDSEVEFPEHALAADAIPVWRDNGWQL